VGDGHDRRGPEEPHARRRPVEDPRERRRVPQRAGSVEPREDDPTMAARAMAGTTCGPHYLQKDPVHDISMAWCNGTAAAQRRYANELWRYTCRPTDLPGVAQVSELRPTERRDAMRRPLAPAPGSGETRSSPSDGSARSETSSDDAIVALTGSATHLGSPRTSTGVDRRRACRKPISRDGSGARPRVEIDLVLSNKNAVPGGLIAAAPATTGLFPAMSSRWSRPWRSSSPRALARPRSMSGAGSSELHATALRSSPRMWPDGDVANHAKLGSSTTGVLPGCRIVTRTRRGRLRRR
jgi:hypothetical protein